MVQNQKVARVLHSCDAWFDEEPIAEVTAALQVELARRKYFI